MLPCCGKVTQVGVTQRRADLPPCGPSHKTSTRAGTPSAGRKDSVPPGVSPLPQPSREPGACECEPVRTGSAVRPGAVWLWTSSATAQTQVPQREAGGKSHTWRGSRGGKKGRSGSGSGCLPGAGDAAGSVSAAVGGAAAHAPQPCPRRPDVPARTCPRRGLREHALFAARGGPARGRRRRQQAPRAPTGTPSASGPRP